MSKQPLYGMLNRGGFFGAGYDSLCAPVTTLTAAEIDTGYDLVRGDVVLDCYVVVKTAEATGTTKAIDVGLLSGESGGDADGFLDGVSTAAIATVVGVLLGTDTLGVLLKEDTNGSSVFVRRPYVVGSTALSLTYTLNSVHTEIVADIYVQIWRAIAAPGQ